MLSFAALSQLRRHMGATKSQNAARDDQMTGEIRVITTES